ncbi:HAMP domain-containing histidine kinase [Microbacterium sp. EYE_512]|uniref:histidine kinase n=2 Tax=Microbacteriaceae TaxID=85023 RepID=A0ABX5SXI4_9MICO|nr:HAMP domain-containing histidine kinase [Microbacterium sp. EYE_512]QBR89525.1 HAMP domain-containing histidine kinase [Microbacterium wangchenii]TXK16877.1 HAMP domain-containing histidine kinase [Microbacterium wangchenii]
MTVGLLAIGLVSAGFGTMAFLRTTLTASLDDSLRQLASSDAALSVLDVQNSGGTLRFTEDEEAAPTDIFVAIYDPTGQFLIAAGGDGTTAPPEFPSTYTLQKTQLQGLTPFALPSTGSGPPFHAAVDVLAVDGVSALYTQMVAVSLGPTERVVAAYVGIYSILALLILIASALLTRWLVTLTFRGLGQVEATAMSIAGGDFSQRMSDVVPGTEVGRLKTAINTMLDRVDAAIRQRDATVGQMRRFIGDASHELRTPLVTVRGYAELYRMGAIRGDEEVAQSMERIEKEAIRMGVLVEDLLALARLDEQRGVVIQPVDLRPIARDAALDLRAASPQREVTVEDTSAYGGPRVTMSITVDPPAETPEDDTSGEPRRRTTSATSAIALAGATLSRLRRRPRGAGDADEAADAPAAPATAPVRTVPVEPVVLGDENRIRQVVANLLGNARRFTGEDSPIELRVGVSAADETGWIEVIDHGEGIPEQIRDQIFQRFWRADTSRARETGGSGLGLSIVASIVQALHGTVSVRDTPGGGATFRVALPLAPPSADEVADTRPLPRQR